MLQHLNIYTGIAYVATRNAFEQITKEGEGV